MKKYVLMLLAAVFMAGAIPAQATEQSEQRQDARGVRQDTRENSRQTKQDCRNGVFGNADCRQEHRQNKREGRQTARDIKY
ncbi:MULTISPECIES: hypothetical protein [Buttiauxella]|jgi:Ni/Co efflux regulator RcnB|uniref:Secreted protein n=1 Tax=Buttiauxella ferragutiae ATCC 51602 TaxID=1354252 RepID=A0ABX2W6I9_9ENTR|nr:MULTISPECIES: hypothetical protein [Buttiauxella]AYN26093.1 hypothetical protein D8682_03240 [Buttiauxella sp. 3AFRM03]MCE0824620.1 hypothetical protein [Buttiauxella ferragutiae]OAT26468.1 hypothetical protein M976_03188 [Buttiauxella ferragutiae ATCC 51602]TDN54345.1 hypothetical protein EC843_101386 [Buttiauxella sp. JUb87]UNK59190.1 hypothetical protein MNO13_12230 [Buttiauxella ferragutiae]